MWRDGRVAVVVREVFLFRDGDDVLLGSFVASMFTRLFTEGFCVV